MLLKRIAIIGAAALGLVFAESTAAFADVSKTGTTSCPYLSVVMVVGKGSGYMKWYWPSTTLQRESDHGQDIYSEQYNTGRRSTSWKVTTTSGYLDDNGTYGWCMPTAQAPSHKTAATLS